VPSSQGNVLLFSIDDAGEIWMPNNSLLLPGSIKPHMPRLAALMDMGVRFSRFVTTGQCSPSRAPMLTGDQAARTSVYNICEEPEDNAVASNYVTLPRVVRALGRGHKTAHFGKHHLCGANNGGIMAPSNHGWDYHAVTERNLSDQYNFDAIIQGTVTPIVNTYSATWVVASALDWALAQGSDPWCMSVDLHLPHAPTNKPPDGRYYSNWNMPTPMPAPGATTLEQREYHHASLESADWHLGFLLNNLEAAGYSMAENLTVLFWSDNGGIGPMVGLETANDGLPLDVFKAKRTHYVCGTSCPLVVAGMATERQGEVDDRLVWCGDLFQTTVEIAADTAFPTRAYLNARNAVRSAGYIGGGMDTTSFFSALKPQQPPKNVERTYLISEMGGPENIDAKHGGLAQNGHRCIIRKDGWKYYELGFPANPQKELYNLTVDPWERTNVLGAGPTEIAIELELKTKLEDFHAETLL
jgi:arylsulfatase A-like enzyme